MWDEEIAGSGVKYQVHVSPPTDIVNSNQRGNLPDEIRAQIEDSNNCVGIRQFKDRLYIGWRSAPYHFASSKTKMFIMSADINNIVDSKGELLTESLQHENIGSSMWTVE